MKKEINSSEKQLMECPHCQKHFHVSVRLEPTIEKEPVLSAHDKGKTAQRSGVRVHSPDLPLDYKKIVVAVEGEGTREVIEELLEAEGFEVIDASSSEDLFSVLERCCPATVLVDFGISKITLTNIEEAIDKASLIVVSAGYGKSNVYSEEHASLLGADDYIERRHVKRDLINKVRLHLRQKGFEETAVPGLFQPQPPHEEGQTAPTYSMEKTDSALTVEPLSDATLDIAEAPIADAPIIEETLAGVGPNASAGAPLLEEEPIAYTIEEIAPTSYEVDWGAEPTLQAEVAPMEEVQSLLDEGLDIAEAPIIEETFTDPGPLAEVAPPADIAPIEMGYDWGLEQSAQVAEVQPLEEHVDAPVVEEASIFEQEPTVYEIEETPARGATPARDATSPMPYEGDPVAGVEDASPLAGVEPPADIAPIETGYDWGLEQSAQVAEVQPLEELADAPVVDEASVLEQEPIVYEIEETAPIPYEGDPVAGVEDASPIAGVAPLAEVEPQADIAPIETGYDWGLEPSAQVAEVQQEELADAPVLEEVSVFEQEPTVYEIEETAPIPYEGDPVTGFEEDPSPVVTAPDEVEYGWGIDQVPDATPQTPVIEDVQPMQEEVLEHAETLLVEETPAGVAPPTEIAPLEVEDAWGMGQSAPVEEAQQEQPIADMMTSTPPSTEAPQSPWEVPPVVEQAHVFESEPITPAYETEEEGTPLTGATSLIEERASEMDAYAPIMEDFTLAPDMTVIPERYEAVTPIPPAFPTIEIDPKELELAKRLARIIVSDIVLYNENKVVEGIRNNTFYVLLKDDIAEGRKHYQSRVSMTIQESGDYLMDAFEAFIKRKKAK